MNVTKITKKIPSTDGIHTLSGVAYIPDGDVKALVHVIHGMNEYIARYDRFMTALANRGCIVFGYDHLGHGHTVNDRSELGFIAHKNGWKLLVDDAGHFADEMRNEYGKTLPFYLFGHSMGSFIARLAAAKFNAYDKLIIMGTGGPQAAAAPGIAIIGMIKAIKGERHVSKLVHDMAFGSYNKRFEGKTAHDWISSDKAIVDSYEKDELCMFGFTVSAMGDLLRLSANANKPEWFAAIDKKKPVLLLSGSDDPVGDYGKGVKTVHDELKRQCVPVTMKLYDGYRHEILNDKSYAEVFGDICKFLGI